MNRDELIETLFLTTEETQRAWKAFSHTIIGEEKISFTQTYALFRLKHKQPISSKEFAACMQLTPGAVTQLIDSLGDYVERTHDQKDRRIVYLSLSKKGEKLMNRLKQKRKAFFTEVVGSFSEKELVIMLTQQQKILAQVEKMQTPK